MLSPRSFTTLHFAFKPVIHFELIFVKGIRCVSKFTVLHEDVHLLWCCLFNSLLYSTAIPLLKIGWLYVCRFISGLYICHGSICLFLHQRHTVWVTVTLQWILKSGGISALTFFLFHIMLTTLGLLPPHKLYNQFIDIHKKTYWIFYWDCIASADKLGRTDILTIVLLIHEPGISLHLFSS